MYILGNSNPYDFFVESQLDWIQVLPSAIFDFFEPRDMLWIFFGLNFILSLIDFLR